MLPSLVLACSAAAWQSSFSSHVTHHTGRCERVCSQEVAASAAAAAFADCQIPPEYLRADIGRRLTECVAIGWLARAYEMVPFFPRIFPAVFRLAAYDDQPFTWSGDRSSITCTLKESSVVARGVPLRLRLNVRQEQGRICISSASLVSIGCDVVQHAVISTPDTVTPSAAEIKMICDAITNDVASKKRIARAVASAMFTVLAPVRKALDAGAPLEICGDEATFRPKRELYGQEGSSDKWLQEVAGYYFAAARLQDVRFAPGHGVNDAVRFTFYLDEQEPLNSEDPRRNVNPEVICCWLMADDDRAIELRTSRAPATTEDGASAR